MSDQNEYVKKFMLAFARLDEIGSAYNRELEAFTKLISTFIEEKYIKPESDCRPALIPLHPGVNRPPHRDSTNMPLTMEAVIALLKMELEARRKAQVSEQEMMTEFRARVDAAFASYKECEYCEGIFAMDMLRRLDPPNDHIVICEDCFDEYFFDCHKCKRILPASEQGEEDSERGYGWFCKDCCKPVGFPQKVIIAPDFEGCEDVAAADIDALCKYALNATGWREPDINDTIDLKFVKFKDGHLRRYAIYRSESGLKCEVGELDWRGIGSLYIYEENGDEDDQD